MKVSVIVSIVMVVAIAILLKTVTVIPEKRLCFVGKACVWATVADNDAKRAKGLSGTWRLLNGAGMLFTFPVEDRYGFWMYGMNYDLDFIWIRSGRVVEVMQDVSIAPDDFQKRDVYQPRVPVDQMLEVNGGWARENKIGVGDVIEAKGLFEVDFDFGGFLKK